MTDIKQAFPVPTLSMNKYVWNSLKSIDTTLSTKYGSIVPFFPLADSRAGDTAWGAKPYVIYDVLFRFRPRTFPIIHKLQSLYYIRGQADDVIGWANAITMILDRGDNSAQDINNYLAENDPNAGVYFHSTKVFQMDPANEWRQDLSVRQYYTEQLMVETDYHITKDQGFK